MLFPQFASVCVLSVEAVEDSVVFTVRSGGSSARALAGLAFPSLDPGTGGRRIEHGISFDELVFISIAEFELRPFIRTPPATPAPHGPPP